MKVYCPCGNDITTIKGFRKRNQHFYCKKCEKRVTDQVIKSLIQKIRRS